MRRAVQIAIVAWFAVVIGAPIVLFGLGQRAPAFENRALAPRPDVRLDNVYRISTYKQLDAFVRDRLPFRDRAVDTRTRIASELFGDGAALGQSTADAVVRRGRDGWLFLGEEFHTCDSEHTPHEVRQVLETLVAAAPSAGRRLVVAVAPGKAHVQHAQLGDLDAAGRCSRAKEAAMEQELRGVPGFVDLYAPLTAAVGAGDDEQVYFKLDSHWNERGQVVAVHALVDAIRPGVWQPTDGQPGARAEAQHDLAVLLGDLSSKERIPRFPVDRRGVRSQVAPLPGGALDTLAAASATADDPRLLVPGRTLLIGDSQAFRAIQRWGWFFADLTLCHRQLDVTGICSGLVPASRLVVLEIVERHLYGEIDGPGFGQLLQALVADAPARPFVLPQQDVAGALALGGGVVDLPIVADDPGGRRVLRLRVDDGTAGAPVQLTLLRRDGAPVPGPFTRALVPLGAGTPAVLVVPAGLALRDMVLRAEAPPGAVLHADGLVPLDAVG
jgi:alginate O-acetyltransferase complex protein AlgJ